MNKLYDALEICLQEIEQGADVEAVLFRYPDLADELRPILETSAKAKRMAAPAPSPEVMRRNRAKLLQRAAEMRESNVKPSSRRIWFASLRRIAVTLAVVAVLFASGTGLVRAVSTTLPGDNLYAVKRTWEDVLLFFTFDMQKRESLEIEHENERLMELRELFAQGRSEKVDFNGLVTRQSGDEWQVAEFPVVISAQTELPNQPVVVGAAVRVVGRTQSGGKILAERVELLPPGAPLPEGKDETAGGEGETPEGPTQQIEDHSGTGSAGETPEAEEVKTPEPESEPKEESFEGIVNSMNGNLWTVNGQSMDVSNAEIKGSPSVGGTVKVEGYFNSDGVFIVTKIEFIESGSNSGSGSGSDDNGNGNENGIGNDNSNDNGNEDGSSHSNDNSNDNGSSNSNDNSNHNGGSSNDDNSNGGNSNDGNSNDGGGSGSGGGG